jgi:hypothetical protein
MTVRVLQQLAVASAAFSAVVAQGSQLQSFA